MSSKDETLGLVKDALDQISSIHTARALLLRLCYNSEFALDFLAEELLTTESEVYSSNSESEDEAAYRPNKRKRKTYAHVRYRKCTQCLETFDITDNTTGCCTWHEGELEFDDEADTWIDWDEDTHGPMDTTEHREEYPDGFRWTCCDDPGDYEGCESGRHSTVRGEPPQKRKRYEYQELREHAGTLRINWDGDDWVDWDEEHHGPINSAENREEYPTGFKWTCCGGDADDEWCQ